MRVTNEIPIELFLKYALRSKAVERVLEGWFVDRDLIGRVALKHFHDMGLYRVQPHGYAAYLIQALPGILMASPEVKALVDKSRRTSMSRQSGRR